MIYVGGFHVNGQLVSETEVNSLSASVELTKKGEAWDISVVSKQMM